MAKCFIPFSRIAPNILSAYCCLENIDWNVARKIMALGVEFLSSSVLWLDMGRFLQEGKFADRSGKLYLQGIEQSDTPLLAICGTKDNMAPKSAVLGVFERRNGSCVTESLILGKDCGCLQDYGHIDLLIGTRAQKEVFPSIHNWLTRWDEPLERQDRKK
jgi:hypothetical protein